MFENWEFNGMLIHHHILKLVFARSSIKRKLYLVQKVNDTTCTQIHINMVHVYEPQRDKISLRTF